MDGTAFRLAGCVSDKLGERGQRCSTRTRAGRLAAKRFPRRSDQRNKLDPALIDASVVLCFGRWVLTWKRSPSPPTKLHVNVKTSETG